MAKKKASKARPKAAKRKTRPVPKRAARRPKAAKSKARKARKVARPVRKAARPGAAKTPKVKARQARRPAPQPAKNESRPAQLERRRRQLPDSERLDNAARVDERLVSAARSGHDEVRSQLSKLTDGGLELTAGDIDARWQDAYAVGDEAPGGDNPTPDQDRVDDIGKALGIQYNDDEELQGGDEVTERDKHRWELDPASSDDWPHNKD